MRLSQFALFVILLSELLIELEAVSMSDGLTSGSILARHGGDLNPVSLLNIFKG